MSQRQPQPQQGMARSSGLEAAAAAAASLLKAKGGAAGAHVAAAAAARTDAMHGGGAAHDQLQKRITELEARLNKSEVRSAVFACCCNSMCAVWQQQPAVP
jgi:hypothetical protein